MIFHSSWCGMVPLYISSLKGTPCQDHQMRVGVSERTQNVSVGSKDTSEKGWVKQKRNSFYFPLIKISFSPNKTVPQKTPNFAKQKTRSHFLLFVSLVGCVWPTMGCALSKTPSNFTDAKCSALLGTDFLLCKRQVAGSISTQSELYPDEQVRFFFSSRNGWLCSLRFWNDKTSHITVSAIEKNLGLKKITSRTVEVEGKMKIKRMVTP